MKMRKANGFCASPLGRLLAMSAVCLCLSLIGTAKSLSQFELDLSGHQRSSDQNGSHSDKPFELPSLEMEFGEEGEGEDDLYKLSVSFREEASVYLEHHRAFVDTFGRATLNLFSGSSRGPPDFLI